ncbi:MAG: cupin domain-containing protein [Bryobacteraceae bacterium]|nr:cupin domain-containing protein [Bryobacteraceae bacterium]
MQLYDWSGIPKEQLNPTIARQVIHGVKLTIARLFLQKGALVPDHSHHHEQVTVLEQGRLLFTIDGQEQELTAGQALEIPPHAAHRVLALEESVAMDVFSPAREDWISGDDAYLRK